MSYGNENGNGNTALANRNTRIEDKIDRAAVGQLAISNAVGGVSFQTVVDLMEFAKLMAISGICIPNHLRGQPGACLAICMQAVEWRMSPYAVANKSYVVNDRISYESQLIHAIVEQRAPLVGRLRASYTGQGPARKCIITGKIKGEDEPLVFESATFAEIKPKNSPLWATKPDLQLFYNASRDWARMYFPDLILGVYSSDEIDIPEIPAKAEGSRTSLLAARFAAPAVVVPHPTDDTRTIDPTTSNEQSVDDRVAQASTPASTARAENILQNAPRAPEMNERDTGGVDTEPPPVDLSTYDGFVVALRALGRNTAGVDDERFSKALAQICVDQRIKQPGTKGDTARKYVYEAASNGALDWATGKIV